MTSRHFVESTTINNCCFISLRLLASDLLLRRMSNKFRRVALSLLLKTKPITQGRQYCCDTEFLANLFSSSLLVIKFVQSNVSACKMFWQKDVSDCEASMKLDFLHAAMTIVNKSIERLEFWISPWRDTSERASSNCTRKATYKGEMLSRAKKRKKLVAHERKHGIFTDWVHWTQALFLKLIFHSLLIARCLNCA